MTGFSATDDTGRVVDALTPLDLRALLDAAPTSVVVQNGAWGPAHFARARRDEGIRWLLEVRSGGPDQQVSAHAPNTDAAYDMLRSWCAADGWWQEAFTWTPVEGLRE